MCLPLVKVTKLLCSCHNVHKLLNVVYKRKYVPDYPIDTFWYGSVYISMTFKTEIVLKMCAEGIIRPIGKLLLMKMG